MARSGLRVARKELRGARSGQIVTSMDFAANVEDLRVWQDAILTRHRLVNLIYDTMQNCRDFDFRSQIQRAATSVMNNILPREVAAVICRETQ